MSKVLLSSKGNGSIHCVGSQDGSIIQYNFTVMGLSLYHDQTSADQDKHIGVTLTILFCNVLEYKY